MTEPQQIAQPNAALAAPIVLSADWGRLAPKRAVYQASHESRWSIARVAPPAGGWSLKHLLDRAAGLAHTRDTSVIVGIDAVIGLPAAFVQLARQPGFVETVMALSVSGGLEHEALEASTWSPQIPFFRVPAGAGGLSRFLDAGGGKPFFYRQIELLTGGKTVFALSGIPGSVGSGSRALWSELAPLLREAGPSFRIWPFDGSLEELTSKPQVILAEVYPRAAYTIALSKTFPTSLEKLAKTDPEVRTETLYRLRGARWVSDLGLQLSGLDHAETSEDDFDAFMTAAAFVRLIADERPLSCEIVDPVAEGGILGTWGIDFESRAKPSRTRKKQASPRAPATRKAPAPRACPIPGCEKVFAQGRSGWDSHAGSPQAHPNWLPEVRKAEDRRQAFRVDFARWFDA